MQLTKYNATNLNEIRLNLEYHEYVTSQVQVRVSCQITNPGSDRGDIHRSISGEGAVDFIKDVNCLDVVIPGQ